MTVPLIGEQLRLAPSRRQIWPVFGDVDRLARVLPGCESLVELETNRFRGVLATRLQFLTLRADVTARLTDLLPPDHLQLELTGRPRGLAGGFEAIIPIDLAESETGGTVITYRVDLTTSGRLASFGAPILRDTLRRQVAELVRNLERELAGTPAPPPAPD
jgi:hypothetical protein